MCRTGPQGAPSPSRPAFSMGVRRRPAPRLQPPRPARTTQSGGLQLSAREPHVRRVAGLEAVVQLPHLRAAPRGHHRSASSASAASGLSPDDATAASGGGVGRDPDAPVRAGSEAAWAEPGWGRDQRERRRGGAGLYGRRGGASRAKVRLGGVDADHQGPFCSS